MSTLLHVILRDRKTVSCSMYNNLLIILYSDLFFSNKERSCKCKFLTDFDKFFQPVYFFFSVLFARNIAE